MYLVHCFTVNKVKGDSLALGDILLSVKSVSSLKDVQLRLLVYWIFM